MPQQSQGQLNFYLERSYYSLTWGTKGYWCELCMLEGKGDPVEIGNSSAGSYWVKENDELGPQERAINHMVGHVDEG